MQVLLRDEALYLVNGQGFVYGTARARILAAAVAYASAYCRERVLALDEFEGLGVLAFCRLLQVALNGYMRRAGRLAWRRTARVAVDAVAVAVVLVPHVRAPLGGVRQHLLRVLLLSVLGAELLSELHGSGRAVLHASAAGDAFLLVHPRDIGASAHVRGVEELRSAQGVAYLDVAVAYRENLALAVDIGDLVDVAIVLGALEYGHGLFVADGAATSGLAAVVRHVADGDAPVLVVVGAAFVQLLASVAAGAYGCAYMAFVPLEPVGNVLYVNGLVLH